MMQLKNHSKFAFLTFIFTVYILSSAANVLIFDWVIDLNFAKIGLLVVFFGLLIFIRTNSLRLLKPLLPILIVIAIWIAVQILSDILGVFPKSSLKYTIRFISAWGVGLLLALVLVGDRKNALCALITAMVISLLGITVLWNIESTQPQYLSWFLVKMPDSFWKIHTVGLYLNPNELGVALILHSIVLSWFSLHKKVSLIIIPANILIAVWGIISSESRSSLLGIWMVFVLIILTYSVFLKRQFSKKVVFGGLIVGVIAFFLVVSSGTLPDRFSDTINHSKTALEEVIHTGSIAPGINYLRNSNSSISTRIFLWEEAWQQWKEKPWLGLGVRGFKSKLNPTFTPHNFIYSILIEQGILGLSCLIVFVVLLVKMMGNSAAALSIPAFGASMLFDDLTWSYIIPVYSSLLIGYWFYMILLKHEKNLLRS